MNPAAVLVHLERPEGSRNVIQLQASAEANSENSAQMLQLHGRFAKDITALSSASARFAAHVEMAEPWWHHFVYLIVDMLGAPSGEEAVYLGDLLAGASAKDVCKEMLGGRPIGFLSVLRKLRPYPLASGYYNKLFEALATEERLKLLTHATTVTPDLIDVLLMLPEQALSTKIISAIQSAAEAEIAMYYIGALLRHFPQADHERIYKSASKLAEFKLFEKWFKTWIAKSPEIEAPWQGNSLLHPIRSPKELISKARECRNCLRSYVRPMVSGQVYFYHWTGGAPAVVCLKKDPFYGWMVADIEGTGPVRCLTSSGEAEIFEQFRNVGIRRLPKGIDDFFDWI